MFFFFFFQAEDGIRDDLVTGVQTCALPICYLADEPVQACPPSASYRLRRLVRRNKGPVLAASLIFLALVGGIIGTTGRSEERRVGKECRCGGLGAQVKEKREIAFFNNVY